MAELGPWILTHIEVLADRDANCERCGERIRYVWVMELQRDAPKKVWRIGSTCGPTLEGVSEDLWGRVTKPVNRRLRLAQRIQDIIAYREQHPHDTGFDHFEPGYFEGRLQGIVDGSLTERQTKHVGLVTSSLLKRIDKEAGGKG